MRISPRYDEISQEIMVLNIIRVYRSATEDQLSRGRSWYETAHQIADMATDGHPRTGAAVIAALSPQTEWLLNVRLACDAIEDGSMTSGHFKDACSKVNRILAGIAPEDVLPMDKKTGQFYRLIADPSDAEAVVIDRHAHDIAVGVRLGNENRGLSYGPRYALFADAYRTAGERLGERPSAVQAVTWVVWTERS